jgi:hypothetical protein
VAIYTENQFVAYELARTLKDKKHFGFYCRLAKKYSSSFLFGILTDILEVKNFKKIQNRGAYFTKILSQKLSTDYCVAGLTIFKN